MPIITRIVIVGYYNHNNIGDDQYMDSFRYFLQNGLNQEYVITFVDCDKLGEFKIVDTDIIIIGGGDILNHYFLDSIERKFKYRTNKLIAVSVGIPYVDILIKTDKFQIVDAIFLRTKQDYELIRQCYSTERVFYLPDISFFLKYIQLPTTSSTAMYSYYSSSPSSPTLPTSPASPTSPFTGCDFQMTKLKLKKWKEDGYKTVVFSLNRHIYSNETHETYDTIVEEFALVIKWMLYKNYKVCFLPFNTTQLTNTENDVLIHSDVYNLLLPDLPSKYINNIMNIQARFTPKETFELFDYFHFSVPMRFHATLFSIYKNVPFLPVFTTKKIRNLLLDIEYTDKYELAVDANDLPIGINGAVLKLKIKGVLSRLPQIKTIIQNGCNMFEKSIVKTIPQLLYIIQSPQPKMTTMGLIARKNKIISDLLEKLDKYCDGKDFRNVTDPHKQSVIVSMVSFFLTGGNTHSVYNYGLSKKLFYSTSSGVCLEPQYNYLDEWNWIINDHWTTHKMTLTDEINIEATKGGVNIQYINQEDNSGVHRSGWNYVYNELKPCHCDSGEILDLYIDRTFHWEREVLTAVGIIPYYTKWRGFIHHTFDTTFSEYNCYNLLKIPEFVQSLKCCHGLYVLSNTLATKLKEELLKIDYGNIPIFVLMHPTEMTNIPTFNYSAFLANPDKKLLHVGGWLRNIFSFYHLRIPEKIPFMSPDCKTRTLEYIGISRPTKGTLKKTVLKNINGGNYIPPDGMVENVLNLLKTPMNLANLPNPAFVTPYPNSCGGGGGGGGGNIIDNNWCRHFSQFIQQLFKNIDLVEQLTNEEYDKLLTNNVLFIHLVDASAVNTIIECIVRNTPIIVNRHPAVVELLGANYPLYYCHCDDYFKLNTEVIGLLSNSKNIYNAHRYLSAMDKRVFNIQSFKTNFFCSYK